MKSIRIATSLGCFCAWIVALEAAEVDISRLPPASANTVEFDRDVRPIFERSCFRCHGPEKPKSGFRLDNQAAALKGGDGGVAIVPGKSAESPLIHYVAGLVEDMEMPPKGKGDPLTTAEIALLRGWIDQGAKWGTELVIPASEGIASVVVQWTSVEDNKSVFREHQWRREHLTAGIDHFEIRDRLSDRSQVIVRGRALQDDYRVSLSLEKRDAGFVRLGAEEFHKFSSDIGGYYAPFTPPAFSLNRDLRLDVGRAWIDLGLTPPGLPKIVLGYEYQYRQGEKSTLQWGPVVQGTNSRNIYPAYKRINEDVHIVKLDVSHTVGGVLIENNLRGEFFDLSTRRRNVSEFNIASNSISFQRLDESQDYFHGANTFRLEKAFTSWLLASGGYLYSRLDSDAALQGDTTLGIATQRPLSDGITLDRESHVANLNALLGPWDGFTIAAGVQADWTRQESFGGVREQFIALGFTNEFLPEFRSDVDRATVEESVRLRYTKIPFTVLFAEARLQQESIGHYEQSMDRSGIGFQDFIRDTDASSDMRDWRFGLSTSPWRRATFTAHYRKYDKWSTYKEAGDVDLLPLPPPSTPVPNEGYSAFIRSRDLSSDEAEARVMVRASSWLKASLSYKHVSTEYWTETDPRAPVFTDPGTPGGWIGAAEHRADIYGVGIVLTPWRRFYWSTTLAWHDTSIEAADNGSPAVVPYRGDVYTVLSSATFALTQKTDLHGAYTFSYADYKQNNEEAGLPVGLEYRRHSVEVGLTRHWLRTLSTRLQYAFYKYDEPSTGGFMDYTAHGVFATLTMRWP